MECLRIFSYHCCLLRTSLRWASFPHSTFCTIMAFRNMGILSRSFSPHETLTCLWVVLPTNSESGCPYLWEEAPSMVCTSCGEVQRTPPSIFSLLVLSLRRKASGMTENSGSALLPPWAVIFLRQEHFPESHGLWEEGFEPLLLSVLSCILLHSPLCFSSKQHIGQQFR